MADNNKNLLEIKNLTKKFGGLVANDNISIHVDRGEIVGIIGANGSGKTTLFNQISGSFHCTSGEIYFKGNAIQSLSAHAICKLGVGRTYQIVQPFTNLTVLENVMVGAFLRYSNKKQAEEKAKEVLNFTGLYDIRETRGNNLTLLQMKRMEIAKALATDPELLLLDEVTAGVNPNQHPIFMQLVRDIRDSGVTIAIIEHVMKVITGISDRMYCLNQGQLIAEGTPEQVMRNEAVIKSYLGEKWHAES